MKNNKHIKVITRDRASAYAKVIAEELPDAMQVADRFHLHQNLLEAIKKALNHELPATIKIPHNDELEENLETDKKIAQGVDNFSNYSEKRYKKICHIQQLLKEGCSYREIARCMGIGRNTIAKYRKGDPKELSMYGIHQSKLDVFHDFILECLYSGKSKGKTADYITREGMFKHMWMDVSLTDLHKCYISVNFQIYGNCVYALESFGIFSRKRW